MLGDPSVKAWLGGIEPAWTLLDQHSFAALQWPPMMSDSAIYLARNLTPNEMAQSAVASNLAMMLRTATAAPGLKLTATGNLARSVVAEMINRFIWPSLLRLMTDDDSWH